MYFIYRGADKSLARPGRKQARKHVRDTIFCRIFMKLGISVVCHTFSSWEKRVIDNNVLLKRGRYFHHHFAHLLPDFGEIWHRMSPHSATQQFGREYFRTVPLSNLVQNVSAQCHSAIWYRMSPHCGTQQFGTECLRTVPLNNLVQNFSVQWNSTIWYRMSPYSATQQFLLSRQSLQWRPTLYLRSQMNFSAYFRIVLSDLVQIMYDSSAHS